MRYRAEYAWVGGAVARDVLIDVADGRITAVTGRDAGVTGRDAGVTGRDAGVAGGSTAGAGNAPHPGHWVGANVAQGYDNFPPSSTGADAIVELRGLTLPGFANCHSHAFHRALRGRTHAGQGSFWTWRDLMYEVADSLDPDSYFRLARATYGEMALAGITAVGEFHYLHHRRGGGRYADPNAMGEALISAAAEAGIRITLLDTLYLTATVAGTPVQGVQERFSDGSADAWAERVGLLKDSPHTRIGASAHSVRAVPPAALAELGKRDGPLHIHLSEQPAENDQCLAAHGCTPTELLHRNGFLGPDTTVVHATHLTGADIATLTGTRTHACFCPTTERDLADGIGPAAALPRRALGTDSHAVVDLLEEARALEMHERLASGERGRLSTADLIAAATNHAAIGWDDAGAIAPGRRADLVTVTLDSPRTAGADPAQAIYAATAADVTHVLIDGRPVVTEGRHTAFDVVTELKAAIRA